MISMNVIVERIQYARTNGHNIGITYKINQFRTGYFCPKLVLIHKHEKKDFKIHPQSAAFFLWFFHSRSYLRFIPVYFTPLMFIRTTQQIIHGEDIKWKHSWLPKENISPHLSMAVIASEDNRFAEHNGFDFKEIEKALKENKNRKRPRGASTISQQTAKNIFLWPASSWIRKGLEVYFTTLIELFWNKERIMEVYLNSIEMGNGIYGAEAVAREHFHKNASKLTPEECALIAASLPNPRKFNSSRPGNYMLKRQKKILYLMKCVPTFPPKQDTSSTVSKKKKK